MSHSRVHLRNKETPQNGALIFAGYEEFFYGFFAIICLTFGIAVYLKQNYYVYENEIMYYSTQIYSVLVKLRIVKEHQEEELLLYAPLVKCNSEHDVHNIIYIPIKDENENDEEIYGSTIIEEMV